MNMLKVSDYLQLATDQAKSYRDRVVAEMQADVRASSVVVVPMMAGPDGSRVPCGTISFPRCVADQFEVGRLTVSSIDDGYVMRVFEPGTWAQVTVYGQDDHILYGWIAE